MVGAAEPRRLGAWLLANLPAGVRGPQYEIDRLQTGILHLGAGAFHRAHQAVYTEAAIEASGGDWGILAVSIRRPDTPRLLQAQQGLYTVETLHGGETLRGGEPVHGGEARHGGDPTDSAFCVIGCVRGAVTAPLDPAAVLRALAAPATQIVTLTVTEKGYTLRPDGALDFDHPDVAHDARNATVPKSTIGWLTTGLAARRRSDAPGVTVLSCDNLATNGAKLRAAVLAFAAATDPPLARWIDAEVRFPNTMVDCIVPATDDATRGRVSSALGCFDAACVQREPFAQWVIEDDFAGERPAWSAVGVEFVRDVAAHQQLKLHVLNLPHSLLAYFGLLRGFDFCREAMADPGVAAFADALIEEEVAPALPNLPVHAYWRTTRTRLCNPRIDHALRQIGEDGSVKLAQRALPLLIANVHAQRPTGRLAALIHAWLACCGRGITKDPQAAQVIQWTTAGGSLDALLDAPGIFPAEVRTDPAVRLALHQPHALLGEILGRFPP